MAASVAATEYRAEHPLKIKYKWTSDANGNASGATAHHYSGRLIGFTTLSSGTDVATANYDVELLDDHGIDLLFGNAHNRAQSVPEHISRELVNAMGEVHQSKLTLAVTNAGDSKVGYAFAFIG